MLTGPEVVLAFREEPVEELEEDLDRAGSLSREGVEERALQRTHCVGEPSLGELTAAFRGLPWCRTGLRLSRTLLVFAIFWGVLWSTFAPCSLSPHALSPY